MLTPGEERICGLLSELAGAVSREYEKDAHSYHVVASALDEVQRAVEQRHVYRSDLPEDRASCALAGSFVRCR